MVHNTTFCCKYNPLKYICVFQMNVSSFSLFCKRKQMVMLTVSVANRKNLSYVGISVLFFFNQVNHFAADEFPLLLQCFHLTLGSEQALPPFSIIFVDGNCREENAYSSSGLANGRKCTTLFCLVLSLLWYSHHFQDFVRFNY